MTQDSKYQLIDSILLNVYLENISLMNDKSHN